MFLLGIATSIDHIYEVEFWSGTVVSFNGYDHFKSEVTLLFITCQYYFTEKFFIQKNIQNNIFLIITIFKNYQENIKFYLTDFIHFTLPTRFTAILGLRLEKK